MEEELAKEPENEGFQPFTVRFREEKMEKERKCEVPSNCLQD